MSDRVWSEFANHIERQVEALQQISWTLANIISEASSIERRAIMLRTLEHYRQETQYFAKLLAEIKKRTQAA
jgi:hypothetical protein